MKKIISTISIAILMVTLVSCGTTTEPVVISPSEYEALDEQYMASLNVGMILSDPWQDANEIEPELFMYYYASTALKNEEVSKNWRDGYLIPEEELESWIQTHFDVTTEHLRTNEYYLPDERAYEFGGLGSTTETVVTNAVLTGDVLTVSYDINGPMDYVLARGSFEMRVGGGEIFSEDFKLLSNQIEWTAQYHLSFPSAMDEVDNRNVFMMDSGGQSGHGPSRDDVTWYDGENLDSIINFYEDEALPALEAEGHADTSIREDGWYWSGTYRGGIPLTIDVQPKYGAATYVISVLYDESSDPGIAENMRERDFMQPPNMNDFTELVSDYVWPLFSAGVLDTTWSMGENVEIPALVTLYANSRNSEDRENPESSFPASYIEDYAQRFFDIGTARMQGHTVYNGEDASYTYTPFDRTEDIKIVSALSYGREYENGDDSPICVVIAYEVTPSEEDPTVLWSGELELELSSGGYKYLSNIKLYPEYPITQDTAYLDELTEKYLRPLMPAYGIGWKEWSTVTDISADDLVNFCAFNNLLDLPTGPDLFADGFVNNHAPAEATEAAIQQYFDVTTEYLRTSRWYGYVNEDGESYENEYIMLHGFGGGGTTRALHAEEDGDLLKITVGLFGPDDELPDRPQQIRLLTIRVSGDGFRYVSNEL